MAVRPTGDHDQDQDPAGEAPPGSPLLTIPQAAALMQIGESKCYELARAGRIPVRRLGPRCIRISRRGLEEFAASGDDPIQGPAL